MPGRAPDEPLAFRPTGPAEPPRKTRKSLITFGSYRGQPAVRKQLVSRQPVWRWYLHHEVHTYRRFACEPPPIVVPRLLDADEEAGWIVLERVAGTPVAPGRRSDQQRVAAIVEAQRRLSSYPVLPLPASPVRRTLEARLLEDPTDPLGWILGGLERAAVRKLLPEGVVRAALDVLACNTELRFAHGDLLPRNILVGAAGPRFVDWECAGPMLATWDPALLYVALPATRRLLEPTRALFATVLFALAREAAFLRAFPPQASGPRRALLQREIADASAKLLE